MRTKHLSESELLLFVLGFGIGLATAFFLNSLFIWMIFP